MRSKDFFEVEKFPTASVRVHHVEPEASGESGRPRFKGQFDLSIRDVTKTLVGSFELVQSDPPRVAGELSLNRMDFGIGKPRNRWNPMSIKEEVRIRFEAAIPKEVLAGEPLEP